VDEKLWREYLPRAVSNVRQGENTRLSILEAAVELFGKSGYRGASVSQIARLTCVVQSALHHHFGGKEQILTAALELHYPPSDDRPDMASVAAGDTQF
jgi:AcrR family transcriptional regulator